MAAKRLFTTKQDLEIIDLYEAGNSTLTIASKYGCCSTTIANTLRRLGISLRSSFELRLDRFTAAEEDEMIQLYQSGEKLNLIVDTYHCSTATFYRVLRRRGIPKSRLVSFTPDEQTSIIGAWEEGCSVTAISVTMGTYYDRVARFLQNVGYTLESRPKYQKGSANALWKGGRVKGGQGYVRLHVDEDDPMYCMANQEGTVLEHRLVMARHLGRALTSSEEVHHIDGKRDHNELDNLQLRQTEHGAGIVMKCLDCGSHNVGPIPIADHPAVS